LLLLQSDFKERAREIAVSVRETGKRPPCDYASPGKATKTGCGKCRQQWVCSHPVASDGMPDGGWPEKHCMLFCKGRVIDGEEVHNSISVSARWA